MDANWWEHILNCSCVLEWVAKKKPFGKQLPLDVQSRIMCMVWENEHKEKWRKVMQELVKIEVCELSEWCCYKSPDRGFSIPYHERRFLFSPNHRQPIIEKMQCNETCRWCSLYYGKRCALEVEITERVLTRKRCDLLEAEEARNGEPFISSEAWAEFVRSNIQWYHDVYQFSLCQVMIPMLVFMEPAHVQFKHKRVHKMVTFTTISTGAELAYDSFQNEVGRYTLYHPQYLTAKHREKQQQQQKVKVLLAQQMKEMGVESQLKIF